jgi:hypothetical protein
MVTRAVGYQRWSFDPSAVIGAVRTRHASNLAVPGVGHEVAGKISPRNNSKPPLVSVYNGRNFLGRMTEALPAMNASTATRSCSESSPISATPSMPSAG